MKFWLKNILSLWSWGLAYITLILLGLYHTHSPSLTFFSFIQNFREKIFMLSSHSRIYHHKGHFYCQWKTAKFKPMLSNCGFWTSSEGPPCLVHSSSYSKPGTGWNLTFQSTEWWLNGDWMMTRKVVFGRISVTIQWPFSRLNGRHISLTFQSAYFFINEITLNAARTRDVRSKGKYDNHSVTGTIIHTDEYLVYV